MFSHGFPSLNPNWDMLYPIWTLQFWGTNGKWYLGVIGCVWLWLPQTVLVNWHLVDFRCIHSLNG